MNNVEYEYDNTLDEPAILVNTSGYAENTSEEMPF